MNTKIVIACAFAYDIFGLLFPVFGLRIATKVYLTAYDECDVLNELNVLQMFLYSANVTRWQWHYSRSAIVIAKWRIWIIRSKRRKWWAYAARARDIQQQYYIRGLTTTPGLWRILNRKLANVKRFDFKQYLVSRVGRRVDKSHNVWTWTTHLGNDRIPRLRILRYTRNSHIVRFSSTWLYHEDNFVVTTRDMTFEKAPDFRHVQESMWMNGRIVTRVTRTEVRLLYYTMP